MRVDDIDPPREVAGSAAAILSALAALGLSADSAVLYQSQRNAAYAATLQQLRDDGHAFPCWCSRGDLEAARAVHHELHRDGRCFTPPRDDRPPAWRLRVPDIDVTFEDALQGPQRQNVRASVGDFVLLRADGLWGYHLACVVDDAFQGVTEVVRGCDLLESTPRQILLQRLLGLPTPAYAHIPLVVDATGHKLAKSNHAHPIDAQHPHTELVRALHFLGQPVPSTPDTHTLLQRAAKQWDWTSLRGIATRVADDRTT